MPTTYTPNLRLSLLAQGEDSGTWGNLLNSGVVTLIENAISGLAAVSVTVAAQALVYANGATDQARNAIIQLSTTTTAAFAVYIPPNPKTYIIQNTSGYNATIYCSSVLGNTTAAGSGVVIAPGAVAQIWSDGTNVYSQNSTPSGTLLDYAGSTVPAGFLLCDGTAYSRTTYATLFSAIGTTWGAGDGSTTFNVPDLRRRTTIGAGGTVVSGPANTVGAVGGEEAHVLTVAELAAHNHGVNDPSHNHGVNDPSHFHSTSVGASAASQVSSGPNAANFAGSSTSAAVTGISLNAASTGITTQNNGSGTAHNIMQPSAVVSKIIKV